MIVPLTVLLGLLLNSCAGSQGFDRLAMRAVLHHEAAGLNEPDLTRMPTGQPALAMPFRLALFFVRKDFPAHRTMRKTEWLSADKQALMNTLAPLRDERIVSEIFLLEDAMIRGGDARRIRQAGQRYGADVVLVVDGVGAVDRYNNGSSWLYATLAGAYLASGTESDALFMIDGSVWDVRAERLYATQSSEGTSRLIGPAMSVEDNEVLRQAKQAALDEFGKRIADQLRLLKGAAPRQNIRSR